MIHHENSDEKTAKIKLCSINNGTCHYLTERKQTIAELSDSNGQISALNPHLVLLTSCYRRIKS